MGDHEVTVSAHERKIKSTTRKFVELLHSIRDDDLTSIAVAIESVHVVLNDVIKSHKLVQQEPKIILIRSISDAMLLMNTTLPVSVYVSWNRRISGSFDWVDQVCTIFSVRLQTNRSNTLEQGLPLSGQNRWNSCRIKAQPN